MFSRTAAGARRWKCSASSGARAHCAATDAASARSRRSGRRGTPRVSGATSARMPSVAPKESWKPDVAPRSTAGPRAARAPRSRAGWRRRASSSSARPSSERRRHQRRPHDRHVAAHEHRVDADRERRDGGLDPRARLAASAATTTSSAGDERHLRARERQHVIRPRGLEGLRRRVVDLGAVAEHHRPHEAAFRPRRHRPLEDRARPLAQRAPRSAAAR